MSTPLIKTISLQIPFNDKNHPPNLSTPAALDSRRISVGSAERVKQRPRHLIVWKNCPKFPQLKPGHELMKVGDMSDRDKVGIHNVSKGLLVLRRHEDWCWYGEDYNGLGRVVAINKKTMTCSVAWDGDGTDEEPGDHYRIGADGKFDLSLGIGALDSLIRDVSSVLLKYDTQDERGAAKRRAGAARRFVKKITSIALAPVIKAGKKMQKFNALSRRRRSMTDLAKQQYDSDASAGI